MKLLAVLLFIGSAVTMPAPSNGFPPMGDLVECDNCTVADNNKVESYKNKRSDNSLPPMGDLVECDNCTVADNNKVESIKNKRSDNSLPPMGDLVECDNCTVADNNKVESYKNKRSDNSLPPMGDLVECDNCTVADNNKIGSIRSKRSDNSTATIEESAVVAEMPVVETLGRTEAVQAEEGGFWNAIFSFFTMIGTGISDAWNYLWNEDFGKAVESASKTETVTELVDETAVNSNITIEENSKNTTESFEVTDSINDKTTFESPKTITKPTSSVRPILPVVEGSGEGSGQEGSGEEGSGSEEGSGENGPATIVVDENLLSNHVVDSTTVKAT